VAIRPVTKIQANNIVAENACENLDRFVGGSRLTGLIKQSRPRQPLITIITATFNVADDLPITIKSIRDQLYENVEWIVVDGGSTDQTVNLLKQSEDVIDYWVSEPDKGIYDAWNKGILLAQGEWIAFLGAGDRYKKEALSSYVMEINSSTREPEFVSSRVQLIKSDGTILRTVGNPFDWKKVKKHMTIAHAGALHHTNLFNNYGFFDTTYSSSGDYEFLMRCGKNLSAIYMNNVTVEMLAGGISGGYKGKFETYLIQKKYGGGIAAKFRFWFACIKRFIRPFLMGY